MIASPGQRTPYPGTAAGFHHAPNAALLIDFDNVTMGIRSDLGKELKSLLNSEVIRGKVAVQRAYADWRRYPQYIVPLAESSIDLIFAPAYGSSKKNATDLRMAIDAMELVFIRPEIGTFILMTGDSDFSSCVLKLKEYGKYVIGVGMRESSSDLLIQNCDEYYSYHSLSGLTRTGEVQESTEDPWVLMKRAAQQMESNGDVMRTDRLKQVMLDLDPAFDEKKIGYSKFSRFVQEAASKGVVRLRKGENGQYEIVMGDGEETAAAETTSGSDGRRGRGREREREREGRRDGRRDSRPPRRDAEESADAEAPSEATAAPQPIEPVAESVEPAAEPAATEQRGPVAATGDGAGIDYAYSLLQAAVRDLTGGGGRSVRDGDVKRRMLDMSPGFDESNLGFSKFTRFLRQAHDAEVIDLQRANGGNYEVALPASGKRLPPPASEPSTGRAAPAPETKAEEPSAPQKTPAGTGAEAKEAPAASAASAGASAPPRAGGGVGSLRGRRGGRAGALEGPPPILPGQVVAPTQTEKPAAEPAASAPAAAEAAGSTEEEPRKKSRRGRRGRGKGKGAEAEAATADEQTEAAAPTPAPAAEQPKRTPPPEGPIDKITARARRGRALRGDADEVVGAPPILPGQAVTPPSLPAATAQQPTSEPAPKKGRARGRAAAKKQETPAAPAGDAALAGLPTDRDGVIGQLTSYKGVGQKTAESLFDEFGKETFAALQNQPERVREVLGDRRAGTLLEQWSAEYEARAKAAAPTSQSKPKGGGRASARAGKAASKASGESGDGGGDGASPKRGSRGGRGRKKKETTPSS